MLANYHTHTFRCHHATGTEREYIEMAIERGLQILGFSDHVPYPFPKGKEGGRNHMEVRDLDDYIDTLTSLKKEYRQDIQILIGFEAEYYPEYFEDMLELLKPYEYEYLLLGQHFLDNEVDTHCSSGCPTEDPAMLKKYVDQVIEGMQTNCFTYLAHPDVINFCGDRELYYREMKRLCLAAKSMNIPLEINGLGVDEGRHYPSERFFSIAEEIGNTVIIGCDAHSSEKVANEEIYNRCMALAEQFHLPVIQTVALRNPKSY